MFKAGIFRKYPADACFIFAGQRTVSSVSCELFAVSRRIGEEIFPYPIDTSGKCSKVLCLFQIKLEKKGGSYSGSHCQNNGEADSSRYGCFLKNSGSWHFGEKRGISLTIFTKERIVILLIFAH